MCEYQTTKKYQTRLSPPYPANKCKDRVFLGNDGKMWESVSDVNGVHRWQPIEKTNQKLSKKVSRKLTRRYIKKTQKKASRKNSRRGRK